MNLSRDDRTSILLAELSAMIPGEGGRVVIENGPDETVVKGDRLGFLRLGIGLAHGTHLPATTAYGIDGAVDIKAYDLFDSHRHKPVVFQLVNRWPPETNRLAQRGTRAFKSIMGWLLAIAVLCILGAGVMHIIQWFSR